MLRLYPRSVLTIFLALLIGTAFAQVPAGAVTPHVHDHGYTFIENKNQWPESVYFRSQFDEGSLWMEQHTLTYAFRDAANLYEAHANPDFTLDDGEYFIKAHNLKLHFLNGASNTRLKGDQEIEEYYNYYLDNDPKKWASHVKGYRHVEYENIYEDIDLSFYTHNDALKYDFIVRSYTDPSVIQVQYDGADEIYLTRKGDLVIKTSVSVMMEHKPYAYQKTDDGELVEVPCKFVLNDNVLSFAFPKGFDETLDLVIDPTVVFSTYSGSYANNFGMTATYDNQGFFYSGGIVLQDSFPTTAGAFDDTWNGPALTWPATTNLVDVVITKYSPDGTARVFSTYFGGSEAETVHSLVVNTQDELCFYGVTCSPNFPLTANAYDTTYNGGSGTLTWAANGTQFTNGTDIYVSRFNFDGTALLGSTLIGGSHDDGVNYISTTNSFLFDSLVSNYGDIFRGEIMVDSTDNIYIATTTRSNDFPIVNGFDNTLGGHQDGVIMKFNPDLTSLLWSSYIGGDEADAAYNIKVDLGDTVYVAGGTASSNFPATPGAYSGSYNGGESDAFAAKIMPDGSNIINATYLGTNLYDQAYFLEIDRNGQVFLFGQTAGAWPIIGANYSDPGSGQFVVRLNEDLSQLTLSTVFGNGGGINLSPAAFLIDICGNIYCSGWTGALGGGNSVFNMPMLTSASDPSFLPFQDESQNADGHNFYLIVLEREANSLLYGTYFGSPTSEEHVDGGTSRFDKNGIVYQSVCAGCQNDDGLPTTTGVVGPQNLSAGCNNGMIKFDFELVPEACFNVDFASGCAPLTVSFDNGCSSSNIDSYLWDFGNNDTTSSDPTPSRTFTTPGVYTATLYVVDSVCLIQDTAITQITVYPVPQIQMPNDSIVCSGSNITLTPNTFGTGSLFHWSSQPDFSDTLNMPMTDSTVTITPGAIQYYYFMVVDPNCPVIDSVQVGSILNSYVVSGDQSICEGDTISLQIDTIGGGFIPTYQWEPQSEILTNPTGDIIAVAPTSNTQYTVTATDNFGCVFTATINVSVFSVSAGALFDATADDNVIIAGESTMIHAIPDDPNLVYSWNPPLGLVHPDSANTVAAPTETTTYVVTISSSSGSCEVTRGVTINVIDAVCEEPDIFIPNAFTPNDDGNNDVCYVRGNALTEIYFTIYDRWGEMVFETTDLNEGWDGTFKGMDVDPGVFVYYLEATCIGENTFFKKGNITVIR